MEYLTIKQVAQLLGVHDNTIRNWIREGIFPAYQLNPSGRILLKSTDIEKAIEKKRIILGDDVEY